MSHLPAAPPSPAPRPPPAGPGPVEGPRVAARRPARHEPGRPASPARRPLRAGGAAAARGGAPRGAPRSVPWEVVRPARPSRVAGVVMAGFRDRGAGPPGVRLIPHPAVTLALAFGPGRIALDDPAAPRRGSLLSGLGFAAARAWLADGFACVQVRLSPPAARRILGVTPAGPDGGVVALGDLWGREAARIGERLGDASCWEERFALIDALLARRWEAGPRADPEVVRAWRRIAAGRGLVRIDRLAAEVGWSRKRLWSRFHAQLGLPPKRAARLVRFDHAVHRLAAGQDAAGVAADCGYADQSHLHRDVVAFTGATPAAVAGEPFLAADALAWPGVRIGPCR